MLFATANGGRSDRNRQGKARADTEACFEASGQAFEVSETMPHWPFCWVAVSTERN
jgi:hypothetical protein